MLRVSKSDVEATVKRILRRQLKAHERVQLNRIVGSALHLFTRHGGATSIAQWNREHSGGLCCDITDGGIIRYKGRFVNDTWVKDQLKAGKKV